MEYGLIENALHSLREAMNYYHEGDEDENATQYKFSILLSAHCAELLLKEVLRRNHPALLYEDIDKVKDLLNDDCQTVSYKTAIQRVKRLCGVEFQQYESYLDELGRVRNRIQHFKYSINGQQHKELMTRAFSAIEYLFRDVLGLRFEDYEEIIDKEDIEFLHDDISANKARKMDIAKEFQENRSKKYRIEYRKGKFIDICCPECGNETLAIDEKIKCKFCGAEFKNYEELHNSDNGCVTLQNILREIGRRKHLFQSKVYECPRCEDMALIQLENRQWMCLACGLTFDEITHCDECGDEIPNSESFYKVAISDTCTDDFKFLCPECAEEYRKDEAYIGYRID